MKRIFYILILILTFSSCLNMNDSKLQAEYIQALRTYNSNLTKHIPNKIPNNEISCGFSSATVNNYSYFYIRTIEKKSRYYSIKEEYIKNFKPKLYSNSPSIVVYDSIGKLIDSLKVGDKIFDYIIVPQELYEDYTRYNSSKLIDYKFDIIILKRKFVSLPSKTNYMNLKTNDGTLPNNFFSGVAFYDKNLTITYWVITW